MPGHASHAWPRRRRKTGCAAGTGCSAGEQDCAALTLNHAPGHRLRGEETGKAGHFPDLEVLAWGFLENAARHIRTDIEDKCLNRTYITLDSLYQFGHLLFLARIRAKTVGLAASGVYFLQQRLQFVGLATGYAGNIALTRKTLGDLAASGVARPDHQHDFLLF